MKKKLDMKRLARCEAFEFRVLPPDENDKEACTRIEFTVSSEHPVQRWFGTEILGHTKAEVNLKRFEGAAVLFATEAANDHFGRRVGKVESPEVDEKAKKLRAVGVFSRNPLAQEVVRDIQDGILTHVSVGYKPEKMSRISSDKDTGDTMRVTRWSPVEMTIVNGVPADPTVGYGRTDDGEAGFSVEVEGDEPSKEERKMLKRVLDEKGVVIEVEDTDPRPAVVENRVEVTKEVPDKRAMEVVAVASAYGYEKRIAEFIAAGMDGNAVRTAILEDKKSAGLFTPPAESDSLMAKKDRSKYRLARAILCQADGKLDGIEGEVHQELMARISGYDYKGGILIPTDQSFGPVEKRATMSSIAAGAGAEVVYDQPGSLIELLRNRTTLIGLGAQVLSGLTGPVPFPKQTGSTTAYWVGENPGADVDASEPTFGQAVLTPRSLMATSAYSRQLLAQASLDVDGLLKADIGAVHALALDKAGWHGKGNAGEPTGIYMAQDVLAIDPDAVPTYVLLLSMLGKIAAVNADTPDMKWAMTPQLAQVLMTTLEMANVGTSFVWKGNFREGTVAGYKAVATANISSTMATNEPTGGTYHGCVAGNFNDILIGMWQAMELITDPYSQKKRGLIEVTSFQMCDILVRRGVSFCKATRLKIA